MRLSREKGLTAKGILTKPFFFQCPPLGEFGPDESFEHGEYQTISNGSFSQKGGVNLRSFPIETLVDSTNPNYAVDSSFHDAMEDVETLRKIYRSGTPFRIIIAHIYGRVVDVDTLATLRTFRPVEKDGEPETRYLSLGFTEWRDPKLKRDARGKTSGRSGGKDWPVTITLRKDGVWYLGDKPILIAPPPPGKGKPAATFIEPLTLSWIARYIYQAPHAASQLGQFLTPSLSAWGADQPLIEHPALRKKTTKIICPDIGVLLKNDLQRRIDRLSDPSPGTFNPPSSWIGSF